MPLKVTLATVNKANVGQLRVLNTTILPVRYSDAFYKDVLKDEKLIRYAQHNDATIGAVACREEKSSEDGGPSLYVMTLGVLAPYRRLKAGHALLTYVLDLCRDEKALAHIERIHLHVQVSNDDAIAFYAKYGFAVVGDVVENYYVRLEGDDGRARKLQLDLGALRAVWAAAAAGAEAAAAGAAAGDGN